MKAKPLAIDTQVQQLYRNDVRDTDLVSYYIVQVLSEYREDHFKTPIFSLAEKSIFFYNSVKCGIMSVNKDPSL